ncbi:MAG: RecX family transcriptional regulator [Dehalococcoidales bacterium]|nr:RecX family transcriptional regulator [Dehalococcoidales bacterium]
MSKITRLPVGKNKKVNLYLDGKPALRLEAEVAFREGLRVGQEIATGELEALKSADERQRCLNSAERYLGYRPRSESELRQQLKQRGFDDENITAVLESLKQSGLVNDAEFARFWQDNRASFRPRSKWLTAQELKRKGVNEEVIRQTVATIDDEESAYRAASGKARRLPESDYALFRRRLGDFLRRRGFGYEVITHVVERMWQERGGSSG